jgi:hypothetical protein
VVQQSARTDRWRPAQELMSRKEHQTPNGRAGMARCRRCAGAREPCELAQKQQRRRSSRDTPNRGPAHGQPHLPVRQVEGPQPMLEAIPVWGRWIGEERPRRPTAATTHSARPRRGARVAVRIGKEAAALARPTDPESISSTGRRHVERAALPPAGDRDFVARGHQPTESARGARGRCRRRSR